MDSNNGTEGGRRNTLNALLQVSQISVSEEEKTCCISAAADLLASRVSERQ